MPPPLPADKARTRSQSEFQVIEDKLDLIISDIAKIKSDGVTLKEDVGSMRNEIKEFKEDINRAVDLCFEKVKDLEVAVSGTTSKVCSQEQEIESLRSENVQLTRELLAVKKNLNSSAQYSRSNCLDIQGVPEVKSENILEVVIKVANFVGFVLEPSMIDAVHRLAPNANRPNAPRNIIVKFCRRIDMEEMRRKASTKRGFSAANLGLESEQLVYVNLAMTRDTRILWSETRKFKAEHHYQFAWITSSGKIFLRKAERKSAILIEDLSDLQRLWSAHEKKRDVDSKK